MPALLSEVELLSPADAAQVLGLSVDMVRLLARDGRLPTAAKSVRGARLFRREDVEELAAARAGRPTRAHAHAAQLYESDDYLVGVLASYVADGLRAGAPCLVIATPSHRDALVAALDGDRLDGDRIDARAAVGSGQLVLLDARETLGRCLEGGAVDEARFREQVGGAIARAHALAPRSPVRAYGEMVDLLWKEGRHDAALELERLWNDLARDHSFELLCAYDLRGFHAADGDTFDEMCAQHSRVVPAESFPRTGTLDHRLREIARLQLRAQALEEEVARRARAEDALRLAGEELRAQNEMLSEALRAKDEFLAMLGHELRNPLAPILAALELVRQRGEEHRELDTIDRHVRHLTCLVDDLLDASRLVRGAVEIRARRAELARVVERAVELSGPFLDGRRGDLEVRVPLSGLPVRVDVQRMTQVISNLLTNAAKYSDPGTHILVSARAAGRDVELRVADHGVGISSDLLDRVFEPFVQQPQALARAQGGLGLGLAIARDIVRLHGGTVTARSEGPGKGAELTVVLPRAEAAEVDPSCDAPASEGACAKGPRKRILVVDDNEDSALLLAELLRLLGHDVKVAHTAADALEIAPAFAPDVALLDIGLPGMDGYELGSRLRAGSASVRLVAVSGYSDGGNRARSAEAGFVAHLVKPVPIEKIVEALQAP